MKRNYTTNETTGATIRNEYGTSNVDGWKVEWVRRVSDSGYYSRFSQCYYILSIERDGVSISCDWQGVKKDLLRHAPKFGENYAAEAHKNKMIDVARGIIRFHLMTPDERNKLLDFPLF